MKIGVLASRGLSFPGCVLFDKLLVEAVTVEKILKALFFLKVIHIDQHH